MKPIELMELFSNLKPDSQRKVISFIGFLLKSQENASMVDEDQQSKITEEPFIGMWENRQDLEDSHTWVRQNRIHEWK